MNDTTEPNPAMIGGVPQAPLVFLPNPARLFSDRAKRLEFLAKDHPAADFLRFIAALSTVQARLVGDLPAPAPIAADWADTARAARMPPIDRPALAGDAGLMATLDALLAAAADLDMPEPARLALSAVTAAGPDDRQWLLGNALASTIPDDAIAPHLFAIAAAQVHLARLAASLDAAKLVPVSTGVCPSCGGRPASSVVTGTPGIENVRYACCAQCATQWNEVRVKCLCCGSTGGISYRSAGDENSVIRAECCTECDQWLKILYQSRNPTLDPIADDLGSLGLDVMMKDTRFARAGANPFLAGY
ncbi:MAG: formate dehydrogenase accessory protein FdhE [Paracoccus sp. (in: a-proteobacteria)]|uniref:formate dehydrogenase accessory protein FdhE n=1 Tax=Paracoccus sp. TaxID=267 RepID=UPI0026DF93E7|nr:formate dehydrogenase accessory protein FdhE [Paracoccus sp. (in: a-proteobacteria)]MDO5613098.1 formate dehydrogenase accessory protein FdhE [Paracoccus sp. (in: a-proteobacteria)]